MLKIYSLFIIPFVFCSCKPEIAKQSKMEKAEVSEQTLSPGTALVQVEVIEKTDVTLKAKIIRVFEYGSNTPSIRTDKILDLRVPDLSKFNKSNLYKLILASEINDEAGNQKVYWGFVSLMKEKNK